MEAAEPDISSKTIFALVLLTVIVSFIGAFVTTSYVIASEEPTPVERRSTSAHVGFTIENSDEPRGDEASGMISLVIEPE